MKIATTIGEVYAFTSSPAEAIRQYEGTDFKYLDYSFYTVLRQGDPFMSDAWKDVVLEAKESADKLGFQFVKIGFHGIAVFVHFVLHISFTLKA